MKKNYLNMILLGIFFWSCNGYLEEIPQNKLRPTTIEDYEQLLNRGYISEQVMPYLDILSDDATLYPKLEETYAKGTDIYMGAYMWYSSHESTMPSGDKAFGAFYNSAYYANIVIENVDQVDEGGNNEVGVLKRNLKGEAYALRAYSYFYLVNLYAKPYDPKTCATDPGIPIKTTTEVIEQAYLRSPVKDVYDLIVEDLKEGVRLMEENPVDRGTKIRLNAIAAKALLARVYLYMQQWDLAIGQAEAVIKENQS